MKAHESSWKLIKVYESLWKFMNVHVSMKNHSFHCAGFLTGAHGLTLISPPLFFGSCKTSCFRDAMNCCSDSLLRARDPNSFPLPSIVERSSRSYLHEAKHCHLGYSVKRKAPWPNLLLQPGNVETFKIFMILLDSIASHLCSIASQSPSSCKVLWFAWFWAWNEDVRYVTVVVGLASLTKLD